MNNFAIINALTIQREILKMLIDHHTSNTFNPYEKERLRILMANLDEQLKSIQ